MRVNHLLIVILSALISFNVICAEIVNLEIRPVTSKTLKQGDVFSAQLILDQEELKTEILKALVGKKTFNGLMINNLESNEQMVTADVLLTSSQFSQSEDIKIGEQEFAIVLNLPTVTEHTSDAKEYSIVEQSSSRLPWLIILIVTLVLAILIYVKRKEIRMLFVNKAKLAKEKERSKHLELIQNARERKDLEHVYHWYGTWGKLITHDENYWKEFESVINKYQYRPTWQNDQLEEVQRAFSKFRGSLK